MDPEAVISTHARLHKYSTENLRHAISVCDVRNDPPACFLNLLARFTANCEQNNSYSCASCHDGLEAAVLRELAQG